MNKDEFVEIINDLQKLDEQQDKLCDVMKELSPDFHVYFYPLSKPIGMVIDLLNEMFEQDILNSDIDYYAYELDWGRKGNEMPITEKDGTEYRLTDAGKLYDYLVKDKK